MRLLDVVVNKWADLFSVQTAGVECDGFCADTDGSFPYGSPINGADCVQEYRKNGTELEINQIILYNGFAE